MYINILYKLKQTTSWSLVQSQLDSHMKLLSENKVSLKLTWNYLNTFKTHKTNTLERK